MILEERLSNSSLSIAYELQKQHNRSTSIHHDLSYIQKDLFDKVAVLKTEKRMKIWNEKTFFKSLYKVMLVRFQESSIQFDSPSDGLIFGFGGRSTIKPQKKLQALSGYHNFSE